MRRRDVPDNALKPQPQTPTSDPNQPSFPDLQVLAEADENDDGVVQYKEFLPVMVDILQSIKVCVRVCKYACLYVFGVPAVLNGMWVGTPGRGQRWGERDRGEGGIEE